jgi:hypothetical protein
MDSSALVVASPGKVALEQQARPVPGPGEVLIRPRPRLLARVALEQGPPVPGRVRC